MADKKSTSTKKGSKRSVNQRSGAAAKKTPAKTAPKHAAENGALSGAAMYIVPIALVLFAVVTGIALFGGDSAGVLGSLYGALLRGLFSFTAFLIPAFAVLFAILFRRLVESETLGREILISAAVLLLAGALAHVFAGGGDSFDIVAFYKEGLELHGGGLIGSTVGWPLHKALNVILPILAIGALVILVPMLFSLTPADVFAAIKRRVDENRAERAAIREAAAEDDRLDPEDVEAGVVGYGRGVPPGEQVPMPIEYGEEAPRGAQIPDADEDPAAPLSLGGDDDGISGGASRSGEDGRRDPYDVTGEFTGSDYVPAYTGEANDADGYNEDAVGEDEDIVLSDVFPESEDDALLRSLREKYGGDDVGETSGEAELGVRRRRVSPVAVKEAEPEDAYRLPPLTLLNEDPGLSDPNVAKELKDNSDRLTAALKEFHVPASILNTLHGPTVTRFEVGLDTGVRVKTIVNLSNDLSYRLAAPGSIRIEAPIPGKSAVGIEVPNKTRATVYLRTLLAADAFKNDKPLWAALGADVAGEGVYCDLSKMPHLLIAGTTGSGKSVCINTIIISILYRNSPDDAKLILIDPKHVEFAPYEGMPHLLVPVVSDMKKAAGALQWAVSEMERRYGVLEAAKVRDITAYNKLRAASEEPMEPMPRILIIIDELADLMMQAKDSVEPSICRIAAKARAAGMHLVIGTQRPDVSVVTGLIKANIPSRIALTVKSQIDSRTMIDKAGAEKLLGNGDMLFNPIGIPEPKRVQGAYVSDEEIAAVVNYLKSQSAPSTDESEEILAEIEREAAKCESPKKGGGSSLSAPGEDGENEDPMLMAALGVAMESGKISTSLIQRRLSLGYGRSAKIIDRMQQLGYVSAPDGQKPREVLITPEQYLELKTKE